MKIAITGANGYIGSRLVSKCIEKGYTVIAVDLDDKFIDKRAIFKKTNIFNDNIDCYKELDEPDVLIHLAWRNGFVHNDLSHLEDLPKHYAFLKNMISSPLKYLSVLGTMHEVGYYEGKIDENTVTNPRTLYGIAKNSLRQALENTDKGNVSFHWLRAFYIVGNDTRSSSVFGKLIKSANEGKTEFPLNSGKNKYDFITLDELCEQIIAASIQDEITGTINICSGNPVSLGEKIEQFIKENNLEIKLNYGVFPDRPYDSPVIYGDKTRISKIMNY